MSTKSIIAGVIIGVLALFLLICFKMEKIRGSQLGVLESWKQGVYSEPLTPKTYFWLFGLDKDVYVYDMGVQVYVMNNKDNGNEEYAEGRRGDAYIVQSRDQQDMTISLRIQWRRLPDKIIDLHKIARDNVEERIIRPTLLNIVKNQATLRTALEAYSGEGLVKLQEDILRELQSAPELNQYVRVEGFVIEHIGLNKEYTDQIVARQVAVQANLKNIELTKAAQSAAETAKAEAQADYERTIVAARRDKERGVLAAEQQAQQAVLAAQAQAQRVALEAEAEKNRNILIAQGEKDAAINRAEAIERLGEAEATAMKLRLNAYSAPGADGYVKIEVAKSMAEAFKNVAGYLPEGMTVNLLAEQYTKGVNLLVGAPQGNNNQ